MRRVEMQHVSCHCGWRGVRQFHQRRYREDKRCPRCRGVVRRDARVMPRGGDDR